MKISKENGTYYLLFNKKTSIKLDRKSDFRLGDLVRVGSEYYLVVNIYDYHNSVLPKGKTHYILDQIDEEELIERAYNVTKFK